MSDVIYGVTESGFVLKSTQIIKEELEADFKNTFGDDLDISGEAVAGQLIGNLTNKFTQMWELLQTIYNYFNPAKATGISLDNVAALVSVFRLPASSTEVTVALRGNLGTNVPIGHLLEQEETGEQFSLDSAVTIALTDVIDVDFSVSTVLNNTTYTVTIDAIPITYTSDSSATAAEIIAGLVSAIDGAAIGVDAIDNYSIDGTANIVPIDGSTGFSIAVDSNLSVDNQASPGEYTAINTGSISVSAGTLNIIVNPISGLDEAYNLVAGNTGRDDETDEEFRIRRRRDLRGIGRATDEAIRSRVLNEVDNVTSVTVISNRSDATVSGRPPHSFETVVTGGDDQEIAEKIWENQPSGIQPFGDITKTVIDSTGRSQSVSFSRPTNIYIWMEVEISLYTEEDFPPNGIELIKENIISFGEEEYKVGVDVIRQRLFTPIYQVSGIEDITLRLASTSSPTTPPGSYSEVNIAIADDEIAIVAENRIDVSIV